MCSGIEPRIDYDTARLQALGRASPDRAKPAVAGGSRIRAVRIGGVCMQTVWDWDVRLDARRPDGLIDGKAPGNSCKQKAHQCEASVALVESGPIPAVHGVVRWPLNDLSGSRMSSGLP